MDHAERRLIWNKTQQAQGKRLALLDQFQTGESELVQVSNEVQEERDRRARNAARSLRRKQMAATWAEACNEAAKVALRLIETSEAHLPVGFDVVICHSQSRRSLKKLALMDCAVFERYDTGEQMALYPIVRPRTEMIQPHFTYVHVRSLGRGRASTR